MNEGISRRSAIFAAGLVALVLVAWSAFLAPRRSLALDPRAASCADPITGNVQEQFALDHASDYRTRFPRMGYSPELENSSPAFVVVYLGTARIFGVAGAPAPQDANGNSIGTAPVVPTEYTGVVCVVTDIGPTIYVNVDTSRS
jgi:hypothetical protein